MNTYQHYSFDLWLTLIRSNPEFKAARALFFYHNLNFKGKPLDEVTRVFRQVDLMCNHINEKTGKNIDADEMYLMVISLLNDGTDRINEVDTAQLYREMEQLVFRYLPQVYCGNTVKTLEHIKYNTPATISILSNTSFIKGITLRKVLAEIGMNALFDFQLYSDETGFSKPNSAFFELMLREVKLLQPEIDSKRIIHVGDNPVADVGGSLALGIGSLLINSNNVCIHNLIRHANHILPA